MVKQKNTWCYRNGGECDDECNAYLKSNILVDVFAISKEILPETVLATKGELKDKANWKESQKITCLDHLLRILELYKDKPKEQ